MAIAEIEQYTKEVKDLVGLLAPGPKLLSQLPKNLQEPVFLDYCISIGRIQLGRPDHSRERKPGSSESHDQRPVELKVSKTINWTSLNQPWEKTVFELLNEEEQADPALKLRIKLARQNA